MDAAAAKVNAAKRRRRLKSPTPQLGGLREQDAVSEIRGCRNLQRMQKSRLEGIGAKLRGRTARARFPVRNKLLAL
jgi:hypothetical protein